MAAWTQSLGPGPALVLLIVLSAAVAAPFEQDTTSEIEYYPIADSTGCYYNFQHYDEGDRIITNEPCLNCTCHNRMLMCYLRVCPFTKAIGQDCKMEKRADQCCPVITCPEVPVQLLTSTTQSSTALGHIDAYGCSIEGLFYSDGARVPSDPNKPCELCYCIRNKTACVMQECTLKVEGCKPVYQEGVCCPVRYDCEHPDYNLLETTTRRLITTTTQAPTTTLPGPIDCVYNNELYADGALVPRHKDKPCEHCYCMRGDIVCAVQECSPTPLEKVNCTALPPKEGQCCPETYDCDHIIEEELTTGYLYTTPSLASFDETKGITTTSSPEKEGEVQEPVTVIPSESEKEHPEEVPESPEKEDHEEPVKAGVTPLFDEEAEVTTHETEKRIMHEPPEQSEIPITTLKPQAEIPGEDTNEIPEEHEIVTAGPHQDEIVYPQETEYPKQPHEHEGSGEGQVTEVVEKATEIPEHITEPEVEAPKETELPQQSTEKQAKGTEVPEVASDKPQHITELPEVTQKPEYVTESKTELPHAVTEIGHELPHHVPAKEGQQEVEEEEPITEPESHKGKGTEVPQQPLEPETETTEHPHVIQHVTEVAPEIGTGLPHEMATEKQEGKGTELPPEGEVTEREHLDITHLPSGHIPKGEEGPNEITEKPAELPQEQITEKGTEQPEHVTELGEKTTQVPHEPSFGSEITAVPQEHVPELDEKATLAPHIPGYSGEGTEEPQKHVTEFEEKATELPREHVTEGTELPPKAHITELPEEHVTEGHKVIELPKEHVTHFPEAESTELPKVHEEEKGTESPMEHITQVPEDELPQEGVSTESHKEHVTQGVTSEGETELPSELVTESEHEEVPKEYTTHRPEGEAPEAPQEQVTESKGGEVSEEHATHIPETEATEVTEGKGGEVPKEYATPEPESEATEVPQEQVTEGKDGEVPKEYATPQPESEATQVPQEKVTQEHPEVPKEHATHKPETVATKVPQEEYAEGEIPKEHITTEGPVMGGQGTEVPVEEETKKQELPTKSSTEEEVPEEHITQASASEGPTTLSPEQVTNRRYGEEEEPVTHVSGVDKVSELPAEREQTEIPKDITEHPALSGELTEPSSDHVTEKHVPEDTVLPHEYITEGPIEEGKITEQPEAHVTVSKSEEGGKATEAPQITEEPKLHVDEGQVTEHVSEDQVPEKPEHVTEGKLDETTKYAEEPTPEKYPVEHDHLPKAPEQETEESITVGPESVTLALSEESATQKSSSAEEPQESITEHEATAKPGEEAEGTTAKYVPEKDLPQLPVEEEGTEQPSEEGTQRPEQGTETPKRPSQEPVEEQMTEKQPTEITEQPIYPHVHDHVEHEEEEEKPGIPGEGSCLVDGQTYKNNSNVPPINHCQVSCKCVSSILQCESVTCTAPPSNLQHCMPVYQGPDSCCPTYSCSVPGVTSMESDSHKMDITTTEAVPGGVSVGIPSEEGTIKPEGTTVYGRDSTELPEYTLPVEHSTHKQVTELPQATVTSEIVETHVPQDTTTKTVPVYTEVPMRGETRQPEEEQVTTKQVEPQPTEISQEGTTFKPSLISEEQPEYPAGVTHDEVHPQGEEQVPGEEENVIEDHTEHEYETAKPEHTPGVTGVEENVIEDHTDHEFGTAKPEQLPEVTVKEGLEKMVTPASQGVTESKPAIVMEVEHSTEKEMPSEVTVKPGETTTQKAAGVPGAAISTKEEPAHGTEIVPTSITEGVRQPTHPETVTEGVKVATTESVDEGTETIRITSQPSSEEEEGGEVTTQPAKKVPDATEPTKEYVPEHAPEVEGDKEHISTVTTVPEEENVTEGKKEAPIVPELPTVTEQEMVTERVQEHKPHFDEDTHPQEEEHVPRTTSIPVTEKTEENEVLETVTQSGATEKIPESISHVTEKTEEGQLPTHDESATQAPGKPSEENKPVEPQVTTVRIPDIGGEIGVTEPMATILPEGPARPDQPAEGVTQIMGPNEEKIPEHVPATEQQPQFTTAQPDYVPEQPAEGVTQRMGPDEEKIPEHAPATEQQAQFTTAQPAYVPESEHEYEGTTLKGIEQEQEITTTRAGQQSEATTLKEAELPEITTINAQHKPEGTEKHPELEAEPPEVTTIKPGYIPGETAQPEGVTPEKEGEIEITQKPFVYIPPTSDHEHKAEEGGVAEKEEQEVHTTTKYQTETIPKSTLPPERIPSESEGTTLSSEYVPGGTVIPGAVPEGTLRPDHLPTESEGTTLTLEHVPESTVLPGAAPEHIPEDTLRPAFVPSESEGTTVTPVHVPEGTVLPESVPQGTLRPDHIPSESEDTTLIPEHVPESTVLPGAAHEGTLRPEHKPSESEGTTLIPEHVPESTVLPGAASEGTPRPEHIPESTLGPAFIPSENEGTTLTPVHVPEGTVLPEGVPKGTLRPEYVPSEGKGTTLVPEQISESTVKPGALPEGTPRPEHTPIESESTTLPSEQELESTAPPEHVPSESEPAEVPAITDRIQPDGVAEAEIPKATEEETTESVVAVTAVPAISEQGTEKESEGTFAPVQPEKAAPGVEEAAKETTEYVSPVSTEKPFEVPTTIRSSPEETTEARPAIPGEGEELPETTTKHEIFTSPTLTTRQPNVTELYTSGPTVEEATKQTITGELSTSAPTRTTSTPLPPSPPEEEEPTEDYSDEDQSAFGPGTCRYGGKVYVSAQQIPRDDPCDFCFCFRSDIICLQQSCPPPIPRCHEEPIRGFCCPRYECPVSMATSVNITTTTTTTTTTLPPHFFSHAYKGRAHRSGCQIQGKAYQVGEEIKSASGPCLHCICGDNGQMKCDPKACSPEPMLRQMIAAAESRRRR